MDEGVWVLEEKIKKWRPESVAIVGKGIWESIWRVRRGRGIKKGEFKYGWQEGKWGAAEEWEGARVFVATSTSGLAAGMRLDEKEEVWRGLGEWVEKRREERKEPLNIGKVELKEVINLAEEVNLTTETKLEEGVKPSEDVALKEVKSERTISGEDTFQGEDTLKAEE